eukprot:g6082.t1
MQFRDDVVISPGNFGYTTDGTLRCRAPPHTQFKWNASNPRQQQEYDELAENVLAYCQGMLSELLEQRALQGSGTAVWVSRPDAEGSARPKTLLLVQGSGRVRAGVWGCSLCINEEQGLRKGTMLGYIERAHALGYRVVVANPNEEADAAGHLQRLWAAVVLDDPLARERGAVDLVVHSNGGRALLGLLKRFAAEQQPISCIGKVAATDSYHGSDQVQALRLVDNPADSGCDSATLMRLLGSVRNYVPSDTAVGEPVEQWASLRNRLTAEEKAPMQCISACTADHASTNYAAMDAIFAWFGDTAD